MPLAVAVVAIVENFRVAEFHSIADNAVIVVDAAAAAVTVLLVDALPRKNQQSNLKPTIRWQLWLRWSVDCCQYHC